MYTEKGSFEIRCVKLKMKLLGGISIPTPIKPLMNCNKLMTSRKTMTYKKPLLMEASDGFGGGVELSDGSSKGRNKVPKGFVAVYVGPQFKRFVIPISFLTMPEFKGLMDNVAEEFGCDFHADGALQIPCDEEHFQNILMTCFAIQRNMISKNHKIKHCKSASLIYSH